MTNPLFTAHHWRRAATLDLPGLRRKVKAVEGFNAKVAVVVTHAVGTMACAYLFAVLTLFGLPGAIANGLPGIIQWVAQTFLQLVLLSIIMVGQQVQTNASDARAEKQFADTEKIVDALDEHTEGGIKTILDAIRELKPPSASPPQP